MAGGLPSAYVESWRVSSFFSLTSNKIYNTLMNITKTYTRNCFVTNKWMILQKFDYYWQLLTGYMAVWWGTVYTIQKKLTTRNSLFLAARCEAPRNIWDRTVEAASSVLTVIRWNTRIPAIQALVRCDVGTKVCHREERKRWCELYRYHKG
jgi:hypothetical protein